MTTVIVGSPPPELEALLQRRRRMGADRRDEVWEGVLHMTPAAHDRHARLQAQVLHLLTPYGAAAGLTVLGEFNLGEPDDYRVPDGGLRRAGPGALYNPTAALVVEIVSPSDESWAKLAFYGAREVDEVLIVDSPKDTLTWLALTEHEYLPVEHSGLVVGLGPAALADLIDWQ